MKKRIHVRVEHVVPSRCREDFLQRREDNDKLKHDAKVNKGKHTACTFSSLVCRHTEHLVSEELCVRITDALR